jgi:hypothetical protein
LQKFQLEKFEKISMGDPADNPTAPENEIEVYAIGSIVQLDGALEARITAVTIRDHGRVLYECVWWNERERNEETVQPWEIVGVVRVEKLRVKFVL